MRKAAFSAVVAAAVFVSASPAGAEPSASPTDPKRYTEYYNILERGPKKIPLTGTKYVPQGLAHWLDAGAGIDAMLVSYYDSTEPLNTNSARLEAVDRLTGDSIGSWTLAEKGHVQAMAMSESYLWIASTNASGGHILRYAKKDLVRPGSDGALAHDREFHLKASSFIEVSGDEMYVGEFRSGVDDEGTAYRYMLDDDEVPHFDDAGDDGGSFTVPSRVQGMAISDFHFFWSRSWGRNADSNLAVDPRAGPMEEHQIVAPNMSQDLAVVGDEIYVVYESSAAVYDDADYKVTTIHHGKYADLVHAATLPVEANSATATGAPPSSAPCTETTGAKICYVKDGDKWYVKDTVADGYSALAYWSSYLNHKAHRRGYCRSGLGSGVWGVCDKNYTEGSVLVAGAVVENFSERRVIRTSEIISFVS